MISCNQKNKDWKEFHKKKSSTYIRKDENEIIHYLGHFLETIVWKFFSYYKAE